METTMYHVDALAWQEPCQGRHVADLTTGRTDTVALVREAVLHGVPARTVASRSRRSVLSTFRSNKMAAVYDAESMGEEHAMTLADVLEDVIAFRPQPIEVRWLDGAVSRRSYPDIGLVMADGSVQLWECKPQQVGTAVACRLKLLGNALARQGVTYYVRTPRWFAAQPRLANARRLARQGDRPVTPGLRTAVNGLFRARTRATFGQLRATLGLDAAELLGAAASGVFAVGIDGQVLGDGSPVRPARAGARSGAFLELVG